MSTPEALRLAHALETPGADFSCGEVAAELRRQHAEIERLTAAHHAAVEMSNVMHGRWIAAEAERDALHVAVCQAVALLNLSPGSASCPDGREAHTILRRVLVAHADAYMDQPATYAKALGDSTSAETR